MGVEGVPGADVRLTQAGARIHELERPPYHWKIEHSPFTDEYGFRSYRIVQETRQLALLA
jgi:hypothetical protein